MSVISNTPLKQPTNYEISTQILKRPQNVFLSFTQNIAGFHKRHLSWRDKKRDIPPPAIILKRTLFWLVWYEIQRILKDTLAYS